MLAAVEWSGSMRGSPATDLIRELGREVVGRGGWRRSSGGGGPAAQLPTRGWSVEDEEGAGALTTGSIRAEDDQREWIDGGRSSELSFHGGR